MKSKFKKTLTTTLATTLATALLSGCYASHNQPTEKSSLLVHTVRAMSNESYVNVYATYISPALKNTTHELIIVNIYPQETIIKNITINRENADFRELEAGEFDELKTAKVDWSKQLLVSTKALDAATLTLEINPSLKNQTIEPELIDETANAPQAKEQNAQNLQNSNLFNEERPLLAEPSATNRYFWAALTLSKISRSWFWRPKN